jgi:hypothetical protein
MTLVMSDLTLPLTEIKKRLSGVVDGVEERHDRVVLTRNGRPAAARSGIGRARAVAAGRLARWDSRSGRRGTRRLPVVRVVRIEHCADVYQAH